MLIIPGTLEAVVLHETYFSPDGYVRPTAFTIPHIPIYLNHLARPFLIHHSVSSPN